VETRLKAEAIPFQFEAALFATKNAAVIDRRSSAIANWKWY
jgi:hypothetical protein